MRDKTYHWAVIVVLAVITFVVPILLFGCDRREPGPAPSPARSFSMERVPWCFDRHGNSSVYPCQWDSRASAAPDWAPHVPPVALYVRAKAGCPLPVPRNVSCYWAPQDQ
jgi:hypothetical protein